MPYRDTYAHRPLGPERKHNQTELDFAQAGSGRKSRHGRRGRQRSAPPDQYRDPCGCLKWRGYRDGMGQTRSNVLGARSVRTYGRIYLARPLRALHTHDDSGRGLARSSKKSPNYRDGDATLLGWWPATPIGPGVTLHFAQLPKNPDEPWACHGFKLRPTWARVFLV